MDRIPIDLDKLALVIGRQVIENMALQQQLGAALATGSEAKEPAHEGASYPLEMDHDRVPTAP